MPGVKGRSGRRKKSDVVKLITGTYRADRAQSSIEVARSTPQPFGKLTRDEKKEFNQLCRALDGLRILTVADGLALELLACSICTYQEARRTVKREGYVLERRAKNGEVLRYKNPWLRIMFDELKFISLMLPKFGLDPASRSSLHWTAPPPPPLKSTEYDNL